MVSKVPRLTLVGGQLYDENGVRYCSRCGRRPARRLGGKRPRWTWCNVCHAEQRRIWREGRIETLVTPEEYAVLREYRAEMKLAEFDQSRVPGRHAGG